MARKKTHNKIGIILILICLTVQANLAMPFLSRVNVIQSLGRNMEPSYIASLVECEYEYTDKEKESSITLKALFALGVLLHPPLYLSLMWIPAGGTLGCASDYRKDIRRLILPHFHGSRYKIQESPA